MGHFYERCVSICLALSLSRNSSLGHNKDRLHLFVVSSHQINHYRYSYFNGEKMNFSCLALAVSVLFIPNYSVARVCKERQRTRNLTEGAKSSKSSSSKRDLTEGAKLSKSSSSKSASKNGGRSRIQRKLDHGPYDHDVINVYPSMKPWQVVDKLNDAANGDTVLFEPGHYVISDSNDDNSSGKICPFDSDLDTHPSYTIKGNGESPSDTVIYGASFVCRKNFIVIDNIEIWGTIGYTECNDDYSYDYDAGLIFRNSILKVFGKPFDLIAHTVQFINSEFINLLSERFEDGLINNERGPLVAMRTKFSGFDTAIKFDNVYPITSKLTKIVGNTFENNCGNCSYLAGDVTSDCSEITSTLSPNTPKGTNIEISEDIIDILRYNEYIPTPSPPISYIEFKKVTKAGETTVYRIPNGYSMIANPSGYPVLPSGFYPVYTDAAHAYQFDSTAKYQNKVTIAFKRKYVFGLDCDSVEFFYYKDGMTEWKSLAGKTKTTTTKYIVTIKKKKAVLDGLIIAAFIPEDDCREER